MRDSWFRHTQIALSGYGSHGTLAALGGGGSGAYHWYLVSLFSLCSPTLFFFSSFSLLLPKLENQVHLYINGVYWGLYNPVERPDENFAASHFGGVKVRAAMEAQWWDILGGGGDWRLGNKIIEAAPSRPGVWGRPPPPPILSVP